MSQRPRTPGSAMPMSSMASSAAKYVGRSCLLSGDETPLTISFFLAKLKSQFHAIAPSQVADPNLARWFSMWDVEEIYDAIIAALEALQVSYVDQAFPRGAAIGIQVRDKHNEFIRGTIYIQYEPTEEDYASLAPNADFSEIIEQREKLKQARMNAANVDDGDNTARLDQPSGVGMGGYVVKTLWSGNPGERKRLFKEIQSRMPAGLVYAK